MKKTSSTVSAALITALGAAALVACSGGSGNGDVTGSPNGSTSGSSSGGSSGSSGSSGGSSGQPEGPSCKVAEDCPNWFCDCSSGPPVNARNCDNGHCAAAANTCPNACAAFGAKWLGTAGGGWGSSSSSSGGSSSSSGGSGDGCGDGTAFTDLGVTCVDETACQSKLCVGTSQHTFCTKSCVSNANCPKGWVCAPVQGLAQTACLIGDVVYTSPISTNASCKDREFVDTGKPCTSPTQCTSGVCGGSTIVAQRYCTERCNTAADCPGGMSCIQNTGDTLKTCAK